MIISSISSLVIGKILKVSILKSFKYLSGLIIGLIGIDFSVFYQYQQKNH